MPQLASKGAKGYWLYTPEEIRLLFGRLTQAEVADAIGCSAWALGAYERAARQWPMNVAKAWEKWALETQKELEPTRVDPARIPRWFELMEMHARAKAAQQRVDQIRGVSDATQEPAEDGGAGGD